MRRTVIFIVALLAIVSSDGPKRVQEAPNPCAAAELRASMAEAKAAVCDLRAEVAMSSADVLRTEVSAERRNSEALRQKIIVLESKLTIVTGERDAAVKKIQAQNHTFFCENFHWGCIK